MSVAPAHPRWDPSPPPSRVDLLEVDDRFRAAVPDSELALARRVLSAARLELPRGPWTPRIAAGAPAPFGVLVVGGTLLHELGLAGRAHAQLYGAGDLLRPWRQADSELSCPSTWTALGSATVAVLDDRYILAARRWPGLIAALHDRLCDQLDVAARRAAICALPRVEDRTLALFLQLADRWGHVGRDEMIIRLPLTHDQIGRMIGARRPTVSLALTVLAESGLLRREDHDTWRLARSADAALAPEATPARERLRAAGGVGRRERLRIAR